jgi:hypothetical protein
MHLVHEEIGTEGDGLHYLVVGIMFREGAHNEHLEPITSSFPDEWYENDTFVAPLDLTGFMLEVNPSRYYLYAGSLTTPECAEVVTWVVMNDILTASKEQLEVFANLRRSPTQFMAPNIRTIMPRNDRPIYNFFQFKKNDNTWSLTLEIELVMASALLIALMLVALCGCGVYNRRLQKALKYSGGGGALLADSINA